MQEYAERLYKSKQWQKVRKEYADSVGGLCEHCIKKGIYKHGEIVHHKIHISPQNINDPSITLNFNNLVLLCRDCHGAEHAKKIKRYSVNADGTIAPFAD